MTGVAATCPGGIYVAIASGLAGYTPASSFCSSKYPLTTGFVTVTGIAQSSTTTAATVTKTLTASSTVTVT